MEKKRPGTTTPEQLVCNRCLSTVFSPSGFKLGPNHGQEEFRYSATLERIEASARQGCNWCQLVLNHPDAFEDVRSTDTVDIKLRLSLLDESFHPKGSNRYDLLTNGWLTTLTAFTDDRDPAAKFVTSRELQHQVASPDAFQQARAWIEECALHSHCLESKKHKLPTRVIEVAPQTESGVPRLLDSGGRVDHYVALSYCWGMKQDCVTRLGTVECYMHHLPMEEVARTIRDAIECTRQLGVQYLWVDAFCIIQDSAEDKIRELASMRRVYQEAHVTIVAANASNVGQGFLDDRAPPEHAHRVPIWTVEGTRGVIHLRPEGWYSCTEEPINARAWTLEERLLSPRLLIYASHTLQWHCQTEMKNWGNSIYVPDESTGFSLPVTFSNPNDRKSPHEHNSQSELEDEMKSWMRIISSYSERTSTYPEDKLRALGGLAEEYQLRYNVSYLAGLWDGPLLPTLLLWESSKFVRPNEDMYLAPTWSWASLKSPVSYRSGLYSNKSDWYHVKLVDLSINLKSTRCPFDQVLNGFLQLKAHVRDACYEPPQYLHWTDETQTLVQTNVSASTDDRTDGRKLPCLALAISKREHVHQGDISIVIDGLLITPAKTTGEFLRVGCFFGAEEKDFANSPQYIIKLV